MQPHSLYIFIGVSSSSSSSTKTQCTIFTTMQFFGVMERFSYLGSFTRSLGVSSNECSCSYQTRFFFNIHTDLSIRQISRLKCPTFQGKRKCRKDFSVRNSLHHDAIPRMRTGICSVALAAILCGGFPASAIADANLTVAFPSSRTKEVNMVQRTLVETWGVVRETFVDPTFNHQDWDMKLQQTMVEMLSLKTADAAYDKITNMLASLGDPFTRIISPKEYQSFRITNDGNVHGVGLFVSADPALGHLRVLSSVDGSPAEQAGIHAGDELLEIDGISCDGMNGEEAAQRLRGRIGTTVTVKVRNVEKSGKNQQTREVNLSRAKVSLSPVSSSIILHALPDGHMAKTGYVRLSSFSQSAATEMENAVQQLENQNVESYILDLRNNPGGLVKAGLDVAQIWLDGNETLVNTIDREGNMFPINMNNGHALTHDPLVVLVNEGSASASEILAGALHDNGRAKLIGHKTFGKGKIQSVTELHDGSALFVTVAKYISPAKYDIDQIGILPDIQCTPDMLNADPNFTVSSTGAKNNSTSFGTEPLERDSCIMVAEHELEAEHSIHGSGSPS